MIPAAEPPEAFLADVHRAADLRQAGRLGLLLRESSACPWRDAARQAIAGELKRLDLRPRWNHAILFTGHMIDAPTRPSPRFPAAAEPAARRAILSGLEALVAGDAARAVGIAGGACGGDLLFHEACAQLGVASLVRLALPPERYLAASVAAAGEAWVRRFHALLDRVEADAVEVLGEAERLPAWMGERPGYNVWQRTNLWLVEEAAASAPWRSLLALWDGRTGDGPGGTQHLVEAAPQLGVSSVHVIRTTSLVMYGAAE